MKREKPGRCLPWDVRPVAPAPFGSCFFLFYFIFLLPFIYVIYCKWSTLNKAVKKIEERLEKGVKRHAPIFLTIL